jgi:hypothetical protein
MPKPNAVSSPEALLRRALKLRDALHEFFIYNGLRSSKSHRKVMALEQKYASFCEELASNSALVKSLPQLIANTDNSSQGRELRAQAFHIAFLSDDMEIWRKLPPVTCARWDVSQLDDVRRRRVLDMLESAGILRRAMRICVENGYVDRIPALLREMETEETGQNSNIHWHYNILAWFRKDEWRPAMLQALNAETKKLEKDMLAYDLLPAHLDEVWTFHQEQLRSGRDAVAGEILARYGGPRDFICFQESAKYFWDDAWSMEKLPMALSFLGYAGGFDWYRRMLEHADESVRRAFHCLMLRFFPEDDDFMDDGGDLVWDDENFTQKIAPPEIFQKYWAGKSSHVRRMLDPETRYWQSRPFDIVEVFADAYTDGDTTHWGCFAEMAGIWTGRHFPLDVCASYEKQIQQFNETLHWLECRATIKMNTQRQSG